MTTFYGLYFIHQNTNITNYISSFLLVQLVNRPTLDAIQIQIIKTKFQMSNQHLGVYQQLGVKGRPNRHDAVIFFSMLSGVIVITHF